MEKTNKEVSAGGLVIRNKKILMVQVKNLEGKIVWTFPKGHLEKKETALAAALREVKEETGWKCKTIPSLRSPFQKVHYSFQRAGKRIAKTVFWFLLWPTKKIGKKDPKEILKVRWPSLKKAEKMVSYPSDKKLLSKLTTEMTPLLSFPRSLSPTDKSPKGFVGDKLGDRSPRPARRNLSPRLFVGGS